MTKYILFLATTLFFFTSCQKVIKVDLNNSEPAYVIEANLYEGSNEFKVKVTKTSNYFTTEAQPVVNDATIQLTDPNNQVYTVPFVGNGVYTIPNFLATVNSTYKLEVNVGGKSFVANASIPNHTNIDSLSYENFGGFGGNLTDQFLMLTHLQDTGGVRNYYRILITKNDTLQNKPGDYYLFDDKIRDGQYIDAPLFTTFFDLNDSVDISLLGMDANVYSYFTTLSDVITSDANTSAAPANPNTNFSNGALGFFGAYSRSNMSVRIKK